MTIAQWKQQAAEAAVDEVRSGMVLGLGHGSTAIYALRKIAELLRDGAVRDILGIPCSRVVEADARQLGIPLTTLEEHPVVELTIDGADEVNPELALVKGGGGALLREKIVAQASRREIIVIDETKFTPVLGQRALLPVEVVPFGWRTQVSFLEALGARVTVRRQADSSLFLTDLEHYILDCDFGPITDAPALAARLQARAGIVGHGLFLNLASEVIIAGSEGVRRLVKQTGSTG